MATYGIDLGTTYSCIARIDDAGRPEVLQDIAGNYTTPSVVHYAPSGTPVVGKAARNAAALAPERFVSLVKRHMGTDWTVTIDGRTLTPPEISAEILRYLKTSAEKAGDVVEDVVITVPAYFGLAERNATEKAGQLAGLNVLAVVPEPVAAALCYDVLREGHRNILVFDLGGGTFDTTAISVSPERIAVVCTDGDHHLGGADWDKLLLEHLLEKFQDEHPDVDVSGDERFIQELTLKVEEYKMDLTSAESVTAALNCAGVSSLIEITRAEFEELTAPRLDLALDITARTIDLAAERGVDAFDDVLLVGGASRMPAVAEKLRERFGYSPKLHDPDRAVAKGAALYALHEWIKQRFTEDPDAADATMLQQALASGLAKESPTGGLVAAAEITSVLPRAFGVKLVDTDDPSGEREYVDHILHANDQLPIAADPRRYATLHHNQTSILVEVWEQAGPIEDPELLNNKHIGQGVISDVPPLPKGSPVSVVFEMDSIGRLQVSAEELTHHKSLTFEVEFNA